MQELRLTVAELPAKRQKECAMFVLGTAGHIDHGKSVLVRALTGIDPDRLREEKERGMTIDLGFAWLKLPSGREVGIVDVPGHEHFIKNMLAGVGGVDLALLVVDANEGVMPQTREHLAILDLLGIKKGIAVITKKDLADDERLSLVEAEVKELLAPTILSRAPVVAVSALTREGLSSLVSTIDELLDTIEVKRGIGRPRLPIDRVFTVAGSGTVVTGTLIDGSLALGQEVEIVPSGIKSRIRGLETHRARVATATPGSRVGVNLVGVAASQIQRGYVLTEPGWLIDTTILTVRLRLLPYLHHLLLHNAAVNFHAGSSQAVAKVRLLENSELKPGETSFAQLSLSKPLALVKGDHFVIRSPMDTLGGGEVLESHPRRYQRLRSDLIQRLRTQESGTAEELILAVLETGQPLELSQLSAQCDLPVIEVQQAVESLAKQGKAIEVGRGDHRLILTRLGWQRLVSKAVSIVQDYHGRYSARSGMPKAELGSRLKLEANYSAVVQRLVDEGILMQAGNAVRLPNHQVRLTQAQQARIDAFLKSLSQTPYSPPSNLIPEPDLLNLLVERREVVRVSDEVVFSASAYNEMVERITSYLRANGKVTVAQVRDMFKTSRKYALALLEHLDQAKVTRRVGDERVLHSVSAVREQS
jgi:selenocysteine-specific elongation factor